MILEAEFSPGMSVDQCVALARLVEEVGFTRLGISDVVLWPDTFVVQSACAAATTWLRIGSMVSNPYSRHPVVLAAAVGSLQELSGGRAFLGLGVGAGLEVVGIDYPRPTATLREALTIIRGLFAGESVDFEGSVFEARGAQLRRPPQQVPPIAVGTRSERVMRLAGEMADTALVGARYLSPATADCYRSWVTEGARDAGRDVAEVEIAPRLTLCASKDAESARRTMKRDTAEFLVTLRPADLDIDEEQMRAIAAALERARGWYFDPEAFHPEELDALVSDDLVDKFSISGAPGDCLEQLRRVRELGFTSVSLKLAPVRRPGSDMFGGLRETIESFGEVLGEVASL